MIEIKYGLARHENLKRLYFFIQTTLNLRNLGTIERYVQVEDSPCIKVIVEYAFIKTYKTHFVIDDVKAASIKENMSS